MNIGKFRVEEYGNGCLKVVNGEMQLELLIGGDMIDIYDLQGNMLDQKELPV